MCLLTSEHNEPKLFIVKENDRLTFYKSLMYFEQIIGHDDLKLFSLLLVPLPTLIMIASSFTSTPI